MRSPAARKDFPGLGSLSWGSPPSLSIAARTGRRQMRVTRPRSGPPVSARRQGRGASDEGKVFADREQGRRSELRELIGQWTGVKRGERQKGTALRDERHDEPSAEADDRASSMTATMTRSAIRAGV